MQKQDSFSFLEPNNPIFSGESILNLLPFKKEHHLNLLYENMYDLKCFL